MPDIVHTVKVEAHGKQRVSGSGVHYLHEEHVVHMDVKPSNILLESNMNPKITDFNISMVLHDGEITGDDILGTL